MALVKDPNNIRLAMLGMVEGNGHPYSWSAIINGGFDAREMSNSPYPGIYQYLSAAPRETLGIPGVRVTHVWCDHPSDTAKVAAAALIPNTVVHPNDVIGAVDAVIIPTDKGEEHVKRARPFIEAGLPVFIDKPLTDNVEHLRRFVTWHNQGKPILSSSCMRYAVEFKELRDEMTAVGEPRLITISMSKSWERYGIHALEAVYPLLPTGGWESVVNNGDDDGRTNCVHIGHACGVEVVVLQAIDLYGGFGCLSVYGTKSSLMVKFADTLSAFKAQLVDFVRYLRTGQRPFDFGQTVELIKLVIAGIRSRQEGGRRITLRDIDA